MKSVYLGNSTSSTGTRTCKLIYNSLTKKTDNVLLSWIDRRCKCGRFLSKTQSQGYCSRCSIKVHKENQHRHYRKNHSMQPEYWRLKSYVYDHIDEIEVGQIV